MGKRGESVLEPLNAVDKVSVESPVGKPSEKLDGIDKVSQSGKPLDEPASSASWTLCGAGFGKYSEPDPGSM